MLHPRDSESDKTLTLVIIHGQKHEQRQHGVWFLTMLPIGNLFFHVNSKGFLVPFSLNNSLLGLRKSIFKG